MNTCLVPVNFRNDYFPGGNIALAGIKETQTIRLALSKTTPYLRAIMLAAMWPDSYMVGKPLPGWVPERKAWRNIRMKYPPYKYILERVKQTVKFLF